MKRIKKLKKFLKKHYPNMQIFFTKNIFGDEMQTVYEDDGIRVDYCDDWEYIEIFGLTEKEKEDLFKKFPQFSIKIKLQ